MNEKVEEQKSERVPHEKRPQRYGMSHVIYRLKPEMKALRKPKVLGVLEGAFRAAKSKPVNGRPDLPTSRAASGVP